MPRKAREKYPGAIFHIMCRSISELMLFRDNEDKNYYLRLLKRYKEKYKCSIYAYCIMNNHLHLHLDPKGFDVSKFMHSTNTAYVRYYNKKYERHGHVFQGRFESRILDSDEYNLAVSAYIHNNPKDIEEFSGKEETYDYSSYGIYLGIREDTLKLVDKNFIMGLFNTYNEDNFADKYFAFTSLQKDIGTFKELEKKLSSAAENEYVSGRKVILRDLPPSKVISVISSRLMLVEKNSMAMKGSKKLADYRAFCTYVLRVLSGLSYREICAVMHNVTISGCSLLCRRGYNLLNNEDQNSVYLSLFDDLLSYAS
jgi:putative transposase